MKNKVNVDERREKMIEALQEGASITKVGQQWGISRQRVHQILGPGVVKKERYANYIQLLGKVSDTEWGRKVGVGAYVARRLRAERGIPKYALKIGCDQCEKEVYAKGLCRNCYARNRHAIRKNQEQEG